MVTEDVFTSLPRPRLIEKPLLTRKEVAEIMKISEREWDRIRSQWAFTEVHVVESAKGLRFLGFEVEEYIWKHSRSRSGE